MQPVGAESTTQRSAAPTALEHVRTLVHAAIELKHELQVMEDPDVIGRDAARIRGCLIEVHRAEVGIARELGLEWPQPPDTS